MRTEMPEIVKLRIIVFVLGIVLFLITVRFDVVVNSPIRECENSMPRDQYCVIIAVPEKEKELYNER